MVHAPTTDPQKSNSISNNKKKKKEEVDSEYLEDCLPSPLKSSLIYEKFLKQTVGWLMRRLRGNGNMETAFKAYVNSCFKVRPYFESEMVQNKENEKLREKLEELNSNGKDHHRFLDFEDLDEEKKVTMTTLDKLQIDEQLLALRLKYDDDMGNRTTTLLDEEFNFTVIQSILDHQDPKSNYHPNSYTQNLRKLSHQSATNLYQKSRQLLEEEIDKRRRRNLKLSDDEIKTRIFSFQSEADKRLAEKKKKSPSSKHLEKQPSYAPSNLIELKDMGDLKRGEWEQVVKSEFDFNKCFRRGQEKNRVFGFHVLVLLIEFDSFFFTLFV